MPRVGQSSIARGDNIEWCGGAVGHATTSSKLSISATPGASYTFKISRLSPRSSSTYRKQPAKPSCLVDQMLNETFTALSLSLLFRTRVLSIFRSKLGITEEWRLQHALCFGVFAFAEPSQDI
jgi:hypothetical protein